MIAGLPLAFTQPLVLLGLLSLPVLWWLLRLVPPRPRRIEFPPTRLLFDIAPKQETPSRTPWWLTLLRLVLAALLIIAAAGPMWNPPLATSAGTRPILLLLDDGWSAAANWDARLRTANDIVVRAEADNRGIALVPLSESTRDISLEQPGAARVRLQQLKPKPHTLERAEALPVIGRFLTVTSDVEVVWFSDGVDIGNAKDFVEGLARARALDLKGLPLGEARFGFGANERETEAVFDLPVEIRNDIARLEIVGERSAGAVELLDKRWRRRTVGVITGSTVETAQPLLASTYYLSRALNPFADVRLAERVSPADAVSRFLEQNLPMLILADVGNVAGDARLRLVKWIEQGGVLVRFAGPRLAAAEDDLVPVKLRRGGRILGGSLTWEQPQKLAGFGRESPFAGMPVPDDITVTRQVLAEPESALGDKTWATLGDGTPLVTATHQGKGLIVLFHVTADTRWSDLPLSGTFVEMLKRIVSLAGSAAATDTSSAASAETREVVPPSRVLDGFGTFGPPPPSARPVSAQFGGRATADHPPGFYGPPEGLLAVNTLAPADRIAPIDFAPLGARLEPYRAGEPQDLRGAIFLGALALLVIDALVVFSLAGGLGRMRLRRRRAAPAAIAALIVISALGLPRAYGQNDPTATKATLETRLAYVMTGDAQVDAISKAGLQGLTLFLAQRTALEAGDPVGLDIARDELAFYPLIYWPPAMP